MNLAILPPKFVTHVWMIFMLLVIIRIRTRSYNITLGMTHAHGSFGVRLEIFRRD